MIARHLRGTTEVPLLRIDTAFPLPPHALYFLHRVWRPFERGRVRMWVPARASSLLLTCAVPAAATSQQQLRCSHPWHRGESLLRKGLPSATTEGTAGTAHGHRNDTCSGSSGKTSTLPALYMYLSGRQESRKKVWATAPLPKSDHSVGWDGTFLPKEEHR